jgi:kynureninase
MKKVADIKLFIVLNIVLKVKFNLTHAASDIELSLHKQQINIACWYKGK